MKEEIVISFIQTPIKNNKKVVNKSLDTVEQIMYMHMKKWLRLCSNYKLGCRNNNIFPGSPLYISNVHTVSVPVSQKCGGGQLTLLIIFSVFLP